ncbi:MAG: hypothetical protein QW197_01990 [Candidatus Aenigmatarchaeota archaeon]
MDLRTIKIDRTKLLFWIFAALLFMVFLLDAITTKVNVCKMNGETNHSNNIKLTQNTSCIKLPLELFPLLRT